MAYDELTAKMVRECERLEQENAQLKAELDEVTLRRSETLAMCTQLQAELAYRDCRIDALRGFLSSKIRTCDQLKALVEKLKLEAQIHAQEARTANATIYEIYQAVSEGTGEPGNWSGAKPVVEMIDQLKAELAEKTGQYNSSVQTRMAFREAYKRERDEVKKLKAELAQCRKDYQQLEDEHYYAWSIHMPDLIERAARLRGLLEKADKLYTDYGLLAQHTDCGPWINNVRAALEEDKA